METRASQMEYSLLSSNVEAKRITSYDLLDRQFPGRMLLSPVDVALALGVSRKRIYYLIESGTFPTPVLRLGGSIMIPKLGLAEWLDGNLSVFSQGSKSPAGAGGRVANPLDEPSQKPKRGRPRKIY